jgi:hypothetical protein
MNTQENWLERQRRMVRCKEHGLHYDPKIATGCYLCLKEAARHKIYRRPKFLVLLASALAMALILYAMFGPDQPYDPDSAAPEGLVLGDEDGGPVRRLDPTPYRGAVEALEQAFFRTPIESSADLALVGPRLVSTTSSLRTAVGREHPDSPVTRALDNLENELPRDSFSFADLESAREGWLRLRERYLEEAAFYYRPPARSNTRSAAQPASLAEYRTLANDLESLLSDGYYAAQSAIDAGDSTGWQSFAKGWRERFTELAKTRPRQPRPDAEAALLLAYQDLDQALRKADALSRNTRLPRSLAPFEEALRQVRKAQDGLHGLG